MKRFSSLGVACVATLFAAQICHAALTIDIEDATVAKTDLPQTVSLEVVVTSTDPDNETLSAVNLPFQITNDPSNAVNDDPMDGLSMSRDLPSVLDKTVIGPAASDASGLTSTTFFESVSFGNIPPLPSLVDYDFILNTGATNIAAVMTFTDQPSQTLFTLDIPVSEDAVAGDCFSIDFNRSPLTTGAALDVSDLDEGGSVQSLAMGTGSREYTLAAGSICVTGEVVVEPPALTCDFDGDGVCDFADLDNLYANIGSSGGAQDIDGSGTVDNADISAWLAAASSSENAFNTGGNTFVLGDVNLDGDVNSTDLGLLLNNFGGDSTFGGGDMNGDGAVNSTDLGLLLNNFGSTSASTSAVPEPSGLAASLIAALSLLGLARPRK